MSKKFSFFPAKLSGARNYAFNVSICDEVAAQWGQVWKMNNTSGISKEVAMFLCLSVLAKLKVCFSSSFCDQNPVPQIQLGSEF